MTKIFYFVQRIGAGMRTIMRFSMFAAVSIVFLVVLLTAADVACRLIINRPILGVADLTMLSMLLLCYLTMGYVAFLKREITIDLFNPRLPPFLEWALQKFSLLVSLFFMSLIVWQGYTQGFQMWHAGEVSNDLRLPLYPFYFIIGFGATLYCIEMLLEIILGEYEQEPQTIDP